MRSRIVIMALSAALMIGALSTIGTVSAFGAVPDSLNLQGILKNSAGNPVPNGSYTVTFRICSTATGGTALWSETQNLGTNGGQFTCMLGKITPVDDTCLRTAKCFLGIQVSPDPEMTPRIPLVSVPFSWRVRTVDGATGGTVTGGLSVAGPSLFIPRPPGCDTTGDTTGGSADCVALDWCSDYTPLDVGVSPRCGRVTVNDINGLTTIWLEGQSGDVRACGKATFGEYHMNKGDFAFVAGCHNAIPDGADYASISGGKDNRAFATGATIGGGSANTARGNSSTVAGGASNRATARGATVAGGEGNVASGMYASVPGGDANTALGVASFAAGNRAKANHSGTFVWADGQAADFASTGDYQFLIRAAGNVGINAPSPTSMLHVNGPIATYVSTVQTNAVLSDGASVTLVDNPGAAVTVYLPSASTCQGRELTIKKISAAAGVVNIRAAATGGGEFIDGIQCPLTYVLAAQYDFVVLVSDGVNHWYVVGK